MQAISSLATTARASIWGESQQPSSEEPPAGETGKGTVEQPYDAGNAPEQEEVSKESVNPPEISPAAAATTTSGPASAVETNDTAAATTTTSDATSSAETADRKPSLSNARMPSFALKETATGSTAGAPETIAEDQVSAAGKSQEEPSSGAVVQDDTNPTETVAENTKRKNVEYNPFDAKPPSEASEGSHLRAERRFSEDRSISPGTRPDGGHAETGKVEKEKLSSKLKDRFRRKH